jgi:hypothetical protein
LKKKLQQALKACIGDENSQRPIQVGRRLQFMLRHADDYRLTRRAYDVLFCSDSIRWQNIKLVVEELHRRRPDLKVAVAIAASKDSVKDLSKLPGVTVICHALLCTLPLFDARIVYLPIPELPRSLKPAKASVVHGLMSIASIDGVYLDHHFDGFEYILCGGPHHFGAFQALLRRRPTLAGTTLVPAGYPKLDLILASQSGRPTKDPHSAATVVYAPTHVNDANEPLASLRRFGEAIVDALVAGGHRVIFRPHPLSFIDRDRALVDRICSTHAGNPMFSLDRSKDYTETYSSADLMVSDLSGTGFTFSLTFSRPCIFFAPNAQAEQGLSGIQFECRHRIGALARNIDQLRESAAELCRRDMTAEIERFRAEFLFNIGKSAPYIVDCLEDILTGRERPEWVRLSKPLPAHQRSRSGSPYPVNSR